MIDIAIGQKPGSLDLILSPFNAFLSYISVCFFTLVVLHRTKIEIKLLSQYSANDISTEKKRQLPIIRGNPIYTSHPSLRKMMAEMK